MIQFLEQRQIGIVNQFPWIVRFGASECKNRELIVGGE
jgi:hypothetical protein